MSDKDPGAGRAVGRRLLALVSAALAIPAAFVVLVAGTAWVLTVVYRWNHPNDYSTDEAAFFVLLIFAPILLPVFVLPAVVAAVAAYPLVMQWTKSN